MPKQKNIHRFRKYLQPVRTDLQWGIYLLGCGGYSGSYTDMPKGGRTLNNYAFVSITAGKGKYYLTPDKWVEINTGDLIITFPDVWHKYVPDPEIGWSQNWIIADGTYLNNLQENGFISITNPVIHPGLDPALHSMFYRIEKLVEFEKTMFQQLAGAELCKIIARACSKDKASGLRVTHQSIIKAISFIENHWKEEIDFIDLARSCHISYPHFRRVFKESTGQAPLQFQLDIKINRAKLLLEDHENSVKEVAMKLGFKSQYYFSRMFKKKTSVNPSNWSGL